MRVLHVAVSLSREWGGPVQVIKGLAERMAERGVEVAVVAPVESNCKRTPIHLKGVDVRLFEQGLISSVWRAHSTKLARQLKRAVRHHQLIHIHELWHYPGYAAYRAAKRGGKPYVVTIHGELAPWALEYKGLKKRIYAALLQRRILNDAAMIQAITHEEVNAVRAFGVRSPISVIPNGIDPAEFEELPGRDEMERLYPELMGKKVVLFLGRIHPVKGLDTLARGFGQVAAVRNDVHLVIAGPDGEGYRAHLEGLLQAEGVLSKTTFTGMLSRETSLMVLSRADVLVVPSHSEVRGIAALEGMICGLPVIITRQCQFPEVEEAEAGIVIDPSPEHLANALTRVLDNSALAKRMGENGRRLVLDRFTWDRVAQEMIQLYRDVLENEPPAFDGRSVSRKTGSWRKDNR